MVTWSAENLQDATSPIIEEYVFLHDSIILIVLIITVGVMDVMWDLSTNNNSIIRVNFSESQTLECIWTLVPAFVLFQIAAPSLYLLYFVDESYNQRIRLKVVGHQWYWSYEYEDFWTLNNSLEFDSYIVKDEDFSTRLLDVDRRTILPYDTRIRALVRSSDVLHAWTVPTLGVKTDACPGRLNQIKISRNRPGLFYGQCSEICGANHRFMPIAVEFIRSKDFLKWVMNRFFRSLF